MKHEPTPEDLLQSLLHDEADPATASRLAECAGEDPELARRVGEELEFSEMLRLVLRGGDLPGENFENNLASDELEIDEMLARIVDGSASRFECEQVVKHLWENPDAAGELKRFLAIDEWIAEAVAESKSGEAFIEALETRMWAETRKDHFVEDFAARLDSEIDPPENVVAFPGNWIAPVLQVGAVAAVLAMGAFFAVQLFLESASSPMVASVVKSSSDVSWAKDSSPVRDGELKSGRYELESGVVSLKFSSGKEMTVQGPALFDVEDDASTFVHHGVALARKTTAMGIALHSKGLRITDSAQLVGIDARSERSTDAVLFAGDGGVCLTDLGVCRELYEREAVKADLDRDKFVDIPYNPHAFAKAWELLSGVEKNMGSVRIEMPGAEVGPSRDSAGEVQVFVENDSFRPEQEMEVDRIEVGEFASAESNPGQSLQSNGDLRSYLLQLWPSDGGGDEEEVEASLTFDHPVVGVIYSSDRLASSDGSVGSSISHVGADFNDLRGLDSGNDLILLSKDRRTLNLKLKGGVSQVDQVRVLVALN